MTTGGRADWRPEEAIRAVLTPGERLLWVGRPERPRRSLPLGLTEVFVALALALLAAWLLTAWVRGGEDIRMSILFFTLFYLALLFAAAAWSARPRELWHRRIAYAVTDRRAIVLERGTLRLRLASYGPRLIAHVHELDRGDGLHDVVFRKGPYLPVWHNPLGVLQRDDNLIGFFGIADAHGAAEALHALRASRAVARAGRPWES